MIELFSDIKPAITPEEGKVVLFMILGAGYTSRLDVHFTKEHPYQIVDEEEVHELMSTGRFRQATSKEVRGFYRVEK